MPHTNNKEVESWEKEFDIIIHSSLPDKPSTRNLTKQLKELFHQELQKAREEEREKQQRGQVKDIKDQVRRKKEHGNAMYEKGKRDAQESLLLELSSVWWEDGATFAFNLMQNKIRDIAIKDQSELDQPTDVLETVKKDWDKQADDLINK